MNFSLSLFFHCSDYDHLTIMLPRSTLEQPFLLILIIVVSLSRYSEIFRWQWNEAMYATATAICVFVHHSFHFLCAHSYFRRWCWCWRCWRCWDLMWMMMILVHDSRRCLSVDVMEILHSTNLNNESWTLLAPFTPRRWCWRDSGRMERKSFEKLCTACSKHRKVPSWVEKMSCVCRPRVKNHQLNLNKLAGVMWRRWGLLASLHSDSSESWTRGVKWIWGFFFISFSLQRWWETLSNISTWDEH